MEARLGPPRSSDLILHPGVQEGGWRDHVSVLSISFWLLGTIRVELSGRGRNGLAPFCHLQSLDCL